MSHFISFPLILTTALLLLASCRAEDYADLERTETADIPFRQDGTLTFHRGEQELVTIAIEIAASDSARTRGLMQRASLPDKSGMLFIFDQEEVQGFWMVNTPLSLDIFYVNSDSAIVNIARYTRPFSSQSISSVQPALYVVETQAGFADTYGITETDRVRWSVTGGR